MCVQSCIITITIMPLIITLLLKHNDFCACVETTTLYCFKYIIINNYYFVFQNLETTIPTPVSAFCRISLLSTSLGSAAHLYSLSLHVPALLCVCVLCTFLYINMLPHIKIQNRI